MAYYCAAVGRRLCAPATNSSKEAARQWFSSVAVFRLGRGEVESHEEELSSSSWGLRRGFSSESATQIKALREKTGAPIKDVKAALLQCGWDAGMQNPPHAIHVCCPIGDLSITELIELNEGFNWFCSGIGNVVVGGWVWGMC